VAETGPDSRLIDNAERSDCYVEASRLAKVGLVPNRPIRRSWYALIVLGAFVPLVFASAASAQSTGDDPCLDNIPDQTPIEDLSLDPVLDGLGGTLPSVLDPEQAAGILAEVYARLPDTTGPDGVSDGFPDLPLDANGEPDFDEFDRLRGLSPEWSMYGHGLVL
jgi:hypothetical protein